MTELELLVFYAGNLIMTITSRQDNGRKLSGQQWQALMDEFNRTLLFIGNPKK